MIKKEEIMTDFETNKFDKKKICLHHIGGRGGGRAFPDYRLFEGDMINILYDADTDCISQIIENNKNLPSQLMVFPYCVGSENKKTKFNINYDPYSSSILQNNPKFGNYYSFKSTYDYILSDSFKAMEIIELDVKTLDSIVDNDNINIPLPDFLSLDTEGTEYDILLGGQKTLNSSVLALIVEVSFQPLRTDQKLFGDICKLLADNNFEFVKFFNFSEFSPYRSPVGLRGGGGFQLLTDALFLRKCDSIDPNDENGQIMLKKLAFFSILYNQIEYALLCLNRADDVINKNSLNTPESVDLKYLTFIKELKDTIKDIDPCYPPIFSMISSYEESKARCSAGNQIKIKYPPSVKRAGLYLISKSTIIEKMYLFIINSPTLIKRLPSLIKNLTNSIKRLPKLIKETVFESKYTDIELLLRKYGLIEQAEKMRSVRKKQQKYCIDSSQSLKK